MGRVERWRYTAVHPRTRPDDFAEVFIRIGRLACQEHYRAGHLLITAWLEQAGKQKLIADRAEFVREQRRLKAQARKPKPEIVAKEQTVSLALAKSAAQHLRMNRNGGWPVSPSPDGDWWLGTRKISAEDLVTFALRKGFVANMSEQFGGAPSLSEQPCSSVK